MSFLLGVWRILIAVFQYIASYSKKERLSHFHLHRKALTAFWTTKASTAE
jgi:hypothetical protein